MLRKGIIFFLIIVSTYAGNIPTIKPFKVDENFKRKFLTYEEYIEGYTIYIKPKEKRTESEIKKLEEYKKEFRYSEKMDETEFYQIIHESSRGDGYYDEYSYGPYKIITSSNLQTYKGIKYDGDNLYDNNLKTAWIEGKDGDGMGESIEYIINNNKKRGEGDPELYNSKIDNIPCINIYNGYQKSLKAFKENNRVKKIKMYVQGREYAILELEDRTGEQSFDIPAVKYLKEVKDKLYKTDLIIKFEIMEIYSGEKYSDTAISEITFFEEREENKIRLWTGDNYNNEDGLENKEILTFDIKSKQFLKSKVIEYSSLISNVEIDFGDIVINTSDNQVYYSEKGWKVVNIENSKDKNIKELKAGDKLFYVDLKGKRVLKEIKRINYINGYEERYYIHTITKLDKGNTFISDGFIAGTMNTEQ